MACLYKMMMKYFQNKYRIKSIRLKGWDYSTPWWYYVTINTKNHTPYFGNVITGKMKLDELGVIVEKCWLDIPLHYPIVELDYFIVMPNHMHGIVIINERVETCPQQPNERVETCHGMSLQGKTNQEELNENAFGKPIKNSLSMIINHFKGSVKHLCNENQFSYFAWQPRFYDRIIRNEKELFAIRKYISENPLKWDIEKDTPENMDIE